MKELLDSGVCYHSRTLLFKRADLERWMRLIRLWESLAAVKTATTSTAGMRKTKYQIWNCFSTISVQYLEYKTLKAWYGWSWNYVSSLINQNCLEFERHRMQLNPAVTDKPTDFIKDNTKKTNCISHHGVLLFPEQRATVSLCWKLRIVVFVESVVSAVLKVMLIRPRISTSELHCALTLRPPEVDQTTTTAAPPQDSQVQRDVE